MKVSVRISVSAAWRLRVIAEELESLKVVSYGEKADFLNSLADIITAAAHQSVTEPPDDVPLPEPPEEET